MNETRVQGHSQKMLAVGIGAVVVLVAVGFGIRKILAARVCSKLAEEVATVSGSALGTPPTAATILAARDAAAAKAQAVGRAPVTVEAAIEQRTNVQLQTTVHIVIEVHAGDCHADFERPLETLLSQEDLVLLAEQGVQQRKKAPKGHH